MKESTKESCLLLLEGVLIGVFAGLTAVLYRLSLTWAEAGLYRVLSLIRGNIFYILCWFAALLLMGCVVARMVIWEGMSSGSGIPQVCGEAKDLLNPSWWRVLVAKFVGGTICIFGGLSLGREGPSIQLGAMAAKGYARLRRADRSKEIELLCCGGGAGLAAAFNAPLAGILFVMEEIWHKFDRRIILSGVMAAVMADFVSKLFFGQEAIFRYASYTLPLKNYWVLVIFGVVLGLAGAGYNVVMLKVQGIFQSLKKVPMEIRICVPFLLAGVLGLTLPKVLAGGHAMVELLEYDRPVFGMLILLLVVKFLFSAVSFGSGAPGGIFFPLLILGSYLGAAYGDVVIQYCNIPDAMWTQFIILGMAGLFAGIVRAPLTGIVLITEMTGSMNRFLDVALVSIMAYFVANLVGSKPIYTSLLENILKRSEKITDQ